MSNLPVLGKRRFVLWLSLLLGVLLVVWYLDTSRVLRLPFSLPPFPGFFPYHTNKTVENDIEPGTLFKDSVFLSSSHRITIKGEVITQPWLENDDAYMGVILTASAINQTVPIKIYIGKESWEYGYSVEEKRWQTGDFATLQSLALKGKYVEAQIINGVDEEKLSNLVAQGQCDSSCWDIVQTVRNWVAINVVSERDINNGNYNDQIVFGPLSQIKISDKE